MENAKERLAQAVKEAEEIVYSYLPAEEGHQKTIFEAMNYSVKAGGKRLRPILMREVYRLFGGQGKEIEPLMAVAGMVGVFIGRFLKMPTSEQRERVKEWLLWAVTQAEAELGSGTGKLKLRQTYDLFIQRFPALAMAVSFDTFSLWVDEALEEMRKLLKENKTVRELVKG